MIFRIFSQRFVQFRIVVRCCKKVNKMGRKKSSKSFKSNEIQAQKSKGHYVSKPEPCNLAPVTMGDRKLQRQQEKSRKDAEMTSNKEVPTEHVSKKKAEKDKLKRKPEPNQDIYGKTKGWKEVNTEHRKGSSGSSQMEEWRRNSYRAPIPKQSYVDFRGKNDPDYNQFLSLLQNNSIKTKHIKEIQGDLFGAPDDFALAHCVAQDMAMGAGIAKMFRKKFGLVGELLDQYQGPGGLAVLTHKQRYIYYLVTKYQSTGKPTLYTLWRSVKALQSHMEQHHVHKLAIPKIGCGLDRLEWSDVKAMLAYIFQDSDVWIDVYYLDETTPSGGGALQKTYVTHYNKELVDEVLGTARIYLGYEDSTQNEEIMKLAARYPILNDYSKPKRLGQIIVTECKEVLCGLIVKENKDDSMHYAVLEKCLKDLSKILAKYEYEYVGIPVDRGEDEGVLHRVISLVQYTLYKFRVGVYWPKDFPCPSYLHPK